MLKRKPLRRIKKEKLVHDFPLPTPYVPISPLEELLTDYRKISRMTDLAELGASLGTLSAELSVEDMTFRRWVAKGREDEVQGMETPHLKLWLTLRSAYAKCRTLAEAKLASCDPERFLQSKTSKLLGDDWIEDKRVSEEESNKSLEVGATLIESLRLLRKQGFDLNEIIDNELLTLNINPPIQKEEDILVKAGIIPKKNSLPSQLSSKVDELESALLPPRN